MLRSVSAFFRAIGHALDKVGESLWKACLAVVYIAAFTTKLISAIIKGAIANPLIALAVVTTGGAAAAWATHFCWGIIVLAKGAYASQIILWLVAMIIFPIGIIHGVLIWLGLALG